MFYLFIILVITNVSVFAQCPTVNSSINERFDYANNKKAYEMENEITSSLRDLCAVIPQSDSSYYFKYDSDNVKIKSKKDRDGNQVYKMREGDKAWNIVSNEKNIQGTYKSSSGKYEFEQGGSNRVEKLKAGNLEYSYKKENDKVVEVYKGPDAKWTIVEFPNGTKIIDYVSNDERLKYKIDENGQTTYEYSYNSADEKILAEKNKDGSGTIKQESEYIEPIKINKMPEIK